jgi:hypothetical protein
MMKTLREDTVWRIEWGFRGGTAMNSARAAPPPPPLAVPSELEALFLMAFFVHFSTRGVQKHHKKLLGKKYLFSCQYPPPPFDFFTRCALCTVHAHCVLASVLCPQSSILCPLLLGGEVRSPPPPLLPLTSPPQGWQIVGPSDDRPPKDGQLGAKCSILRSTSLEQSAQKSDPLGYWP